MIRSLLRKGERVWPILLMAICTGLLYGLMIFIFRDAIDALGTLSHFQRAHDGPPILFLIGSIILGWFSVALVERRLDFAGYACLFVTAPCILAALLGGYLFGLHLGTADSSELAELMIFSAFVAIATATFRCYLNNPE